MEIRTATEADASVLAEHWAAFSAETDYAPYPPQPFADAFLTDHTCLVAVEDGTIAGTAYVNRSSPHFGFLFGLYVVPGQRRRGIARQLLAAAAELLRADGRGYLVLSVDTPNETARDLYDALGFEDAARMLRADVEQLLG